MSKTVLIVEDNAKNLKLFTLLTNSLGHKTLAATDGEEAVRTAKAELPDLILMDIQMPTMDGITALRQLKSDDRTKSIPVLALTSYAMKGDMERLIGYGFTGYLAKPINKDSFIGAIEKALRHEISGKEKP